MLAVCLAVLVLFAFLLSCCLGPIFNLPWGKETGPVRWKLIGIASMSQTAFLGLSFAFMAGLHGTRHPAFQVAGCLASLAGFLSVATFLGDIAITLLALAA